MRNEMMNELVDMFKLVKDGELPRTALPRMFYFGHKLVCTYYSRERKFRCVKCKHDFEVLHVAGCEMDSTCPLCNSIDDVYDTTGDSQWNAKWRCKDCSHEWIGENGYICPSCGSEVKK